VPATRLPKQRASELANALITELAALSPEQRRDSEAGQGVIGDRTGHFTDPITGAEYLQSASVFRDPRSGDDLVTVYIRSAPRKSALPAPLRVLGALRATRYARTVRLPGADEPTQ
jgi:hypothetical protein